jgi:chromosome segregation ATPase
MAGKTSSRTARNTGPQTTTSDITAIFNEFEERLKLLGDVKKQIAERVGHEKVLVAQEQREALDEIEQERELVKAERAGLERDKAAFRAEREKVDAEREKLDLERAALDEERVQLEQDWRNYHWYQGEFETQKQQFAEYKARIDQVAAQFEERETHLREQTDEVEALRDQTEAALADLDRRRVQVQQGWEGLARVRGSLDALSVTIANEQPVLAPFHANLDGAPLTADFGGRELRPAA